VDAHRTTRQSDAEMGVVGNVVDPLETSRIKRGDDDGR